MDDDEMKQISEKAKKSLDVEVKKSSKTKKSLVIVLAIGGGFLFIIFIVFLGVNLTTQRSSQQLDPNSPKLNEAREDSKQSISSIFDELEQNNEEFTYFAESTHDRCYTGQNNWKVKTGYSHGCGYRVTRYYGFDADFKDTLINLESYLLGNGWQSYSTRTEQPIQFVIEKYYDPFIVEKQELKYYPDGSYGVNDLPAPGSYNKESTALVIEYADKEIESLFSLEFTQNNTSGFITFHETKDFIDIEDVINQIKNKHKYIIAISVQNTYFLN